MKTNALIILTIVVAMFVNKIQAQVQVTGEITDVDGAPIPGATVIEKGTNNGVAADFDGNYSIAVSSYSSTLVFSSVGFAPKEELVGQRSRINIVLLEDSQRLDEVVVVGYGTQKKSDVTGAVASFSAADIEEQGPKINVLQSLQGSLAGLNVSQVSNNASQDDFNITIRGVNSITANNQPLIVLDGVPYSGGFNEIEQSDIQSIEVLKDASSSAIYGARGANGVILITTKKGKTGKPQITYNGSYGIQELYNLPPIMSGEEYWEFANERVGSDQVNSFPTLVENFNAGRSVDWVDLVTRSGQQHRHALKFSGGSDYVNYFLSAALTDVTGVAIGDDFQQVVARANISIKPLEWLEIGTNTQYTFQDNSGVPPDLSGNFTGAFFANPLTNAFDENGEIQLIPWPEEPLFGNPLANQNVIDDDIDRRLFSNNYVLIKLPFIDGLSYRLNTGYSIATRALGRFWGSNTIEGFRNQGQARTLNSEETDVLLENIIVYDKTFGKHNLNLTGLLSTQEIRREVRDVFSQRFPTEVLTYYQHDVAEVIVPNNTFSEQKFVSQMGRINYNFDSRYLLTGTIRRDGYSGFGQNNKFGTFFSGALGWNIHNEKFLEEIENINQLKLRLTYGENGNQAIDPFQTVSRLNERNYLGGSGNTTAPGYFPGTLATPGLTWETSKSLNAGIDFALFKNRISGSLDVYTTDTEDLLLERSISSVHGISNVTQNIGKTSNQGIEFLLNTININSEDFSWSTNFNIASNRNEIVDLYGDGTDDINNGWFIGESIDVNFDFLFDGVWQVGEDNSLQPDSQPGDVKIRDVNGDGVIDPDDRTFIGQRNPKYIAGLTNSFRYKNLSLSFSLFTQQGVTRVNPLYDTDIVFLDARLNTIMLNRWSEDNPINSYPANRNGTNPFDVRFYQDASFVRLRNITLAYDLPKDLLDKMGVSNLRIYANANNPFTFTDWEGLDPELVSQRDVPINRTITLGIDITL
ncbi:SusC/RagA family TonB-linked outer membrane protein [Ulvibacterium sp.]|uniref:SusC/RagA family TonB-linked outer membrane protein n=1 Tax=Ulvibacterium sp. TaxID=2665914 RepID=UPI003BA8F71D